ncbi:sulfotransferase domain-containing protein (plasmid) [Phyllobacterium sp. A18/5-2]|uniref:sulfotransferase domain-containing protein n=1 Tax=Phyllobacterium sp. A18/5-2 TaxID=2978392 RepID=UPI0021C91002|nr:sulfotransferase domain-containing protein [Phyllobacterium sp. A18/5-2]UXN66759.1 sulfotransferase domain-containing protein [Phyllobacterium sp. A18/5-2]
MLVWLASYPRSGNTFVRTILKECFDIKTQTLYGESDNSVFATPELRDVVGCTSNGLVNQELINYAHSAHEPIVIKTHEPPLTEGKTIHIVRDGRSAIISYVHYMAEVESYPVPLESIIRGDVYAGSWSDHYRAWANRPNTLMLRYEDLVSDPNAGAHRISAFLGAPVLRRFSKSFSELKSLKPAFFRKGSDEANIAEMEPYKDLFIECHAEVMHELAYKC